MNRLSARFTNELTPINMFTQLSRTIRRTPGFLVMSVFAFALTFTACKDQENPVTIPTGKNIAELVTTDPRFTFLTAAVTKAGLGATLSGKDKFTVFAPTDDAFKASGIPDIAAINSMSTADLTNVLLYHVLPGTVMAADIPAGQTPKQTALTTPNNGMVYISKAATPATGTTGVSINNARVSQADVAATNGTIHVIDRVLMPAKGNIVAIAQADTTLSLLVTAALRVGPAVISALGGTTALTVFAPTNAAFRATPYSTAALINAAPIDSLTKILTYHVVAGPTGTRAFSPTLTNGLVVTTVQTGTATVGVSPTGVTVTGKGNGGNAAKVVVADINATNGVIHKIDRILMP